MGLLDISKPAVSRALESLEVKEYVSRQKDPFDKRASTVVKTVFLQVEMETPFFVFNYAPGLAIFTADGQPPLSGEADLFNPGSDCLRFARKYYPAKRRSEGRKVQC